MKTFHALNLVLIECHGDRLCALRCQGDHAGGGIEVILQRAFIDDANDALWFEPDRRVIVLRRFSCSLDFEFWRDALRPWRRTRWAFVQDIVGKTDGILDLWGREQDVEEQQAKISDIGQGLKAVSAEILHGEFEGASDRQKAFLRTMLRFAKWPICQRAAEIITITK
jgi:hypothetical protein